MTFRRVIIAIIQLMTMLTFMSVSAHAADRMIYKQVKSGQTFTAIADTHDDDYNVTYYCYYFTLPSPGTVTFSLKNASSFHLYNSKNKPALKKDDNALYSSYDPLAKKTFALDKGTYYFRIWSNNNKGRVKYTFEKGMFSKNYCLSKAQFLNKNKTVRIVQTRNNHYYRWYKLVLKKKQAITYFTNSGNSIVLYDEDLNVIDCERAGSESPKYFTSTKQPKGTYYARVSWGTDYSFKYVGACITFKWK